MGVSRHTTVERLVPSDIGHIVRFTATGSTSTEFAVDAVLLAYRRDYMGYRFRLRLFTEDRNGIFVGVLEDDWLGPMKPWQPVQVLGRSGEVSLGTKGSDSLADRLAPALRDALNELHKQSENNT